jgi:hypothetical protein
MCETKKVIEEPETEFDRALRRWPQDDPRDNPPPPAA